MDDKNLINKLKKYLPFEVEIRPEIIEQLKKEGKPIKNKLKVDDVYDTGEFGGIVCMIPNKDELLAFSLTHIIINDTHPLAAEIRIYQNKRILQLRREGC